MHLITIVGLVWLALSLTFLTLLAWSYNAKLRAIAAQAAEPHPRAGHDSGAGGAPIAGHGGRTLQPDSG